MLLNSIIKIILFTDKKKFQLLSQTQIYIFNRGHIQVQNKIIDIVDFGLGHILVCIPILIITYYVTFSTNKKPNCSENLLKR